MTTLKKNNLFFISSAAIAIIVFFILIRAWYGNVVSAAINSHQTTQLQMAKTIEVGVTQFFGHLNDHMESIFYEYEGGDFFPTKFSAEADNDLLQYGIMDYFILEDANFVSILKKSDLSIDNLAAIKGKGDGLLNLGLNEEETSVNFLFIRTFKLSNDKTISAAALIDADKFFDKLTEPLELSPLDFVWVLNSDGYLIYHPEHEEMLMRNIYTYNEECIECHYSFEMQSQILKSKQGSEIYFIGDENRKVMAYKHLEYMNIDWTIVVSTFYDKIIADYSDQFKFISLASVIVFVIIGVSFTSNYVLNIRRIKEKEKEILWKRKRKFSLNWSKHQSWLRWGNW